MIANVVNLGQLTRNIFRVIQLKPSKLNWGKQRALIDT